MIFSKGRKAPQNNAQNDARLDLKRIQEESSHLAHELNTIQAAWTNSVAFEQLLNGLIVNSRSVSGMKVIKDVCQELIRIEKYEISEKILRRTQGEHADNAVISELLARSYHFLGDYEREALSWRRAAALSGRIEFSVCEGDAWLRADKHELATPIFSELFVSQPSRFDVCAGLAECAFRKHDFVTALANWGQAAALDPSNLNAKLQCFNIQLQTGDLAEAETTLQGIEANWPDDPLTFEAQARFFKCIGDFPAALACSAKSIELAPNFAGAAKTNASLLSILGRTDEARMVLRLLLAKHPKDLDGFTMLAELEEQSGRPSVALATWRGLANIHPHFVRAHIAIARLENRNRPPLAFRDALQKIAQTFPQTAEPLTYIADIDLSSEKKESAKSLWERVLLLKSDIPDYWLRYASALREANDLEKAEQVLWSGLRRFPHDQHLLNDAFEVSNGLEHQAKAVEACRRLIEVVRKRFRSGSYQAPDMDNPLFSNYTRLAWLLFNVADFKSTDAVCQEINDIWPNCAFYLEIKAMIALRERRWIDALNQSRAYNCFFPEYARGIELEFEALLGSNQRAQAIEMLAREDLGIQFPDLRRQFSTWRESAQTILPAVQPTDSRLVIDVTSLATVVAASAAPGGIERTIVEVVLDLCENWKGNLALVNWKTIPVEVTLADFHTAVFPTAQAESASTKVNPFTQRKLVKGERVYEPSSHDAVVILGSAWHYDPNNAILAAYKSAGARVALYIHDLLQLYYPALVSEKWASIFRNWIGPALDHSDLVMANSNHSAQEVLQFCSETGRDPIQAVKVELGDDYRCLPRARRAEEDKISPILGLANGAGYVLYVSALGKRKNHGFLVRAWDRLRTILADKCPALVFVGSPGDGISALEADLKATNYAGGKVILLHNVGDAHLEQLYANCLFTTFPSLCEGWGLPIAEALSHGKVCLASNTTSMPEVGGECADYFAPTDEDTFIALARKYIQEPLLLRNREKEIAEQYKRREWQRTTANLISLIEQRLLGEGKQILTRVETIAQASGVIQVCGSIGRQCGIASYTTHVAAALRSQGRETVIVRGIDECAPFLMTGRYSHILVQHEYGLYDSFNPALAGPDTTASLLKRMEEYADRYPALRQAVVMHTIDVNKPELRERSQMFFASSIPVITLSSTAARQTKAIFVEHGIHIPAAENGKDNDGTPEVRKIKQGQLTVSSFGFLSPHKRIDRMLEACADAGSRLVGNFACDSEERVTQARALAERLGVNTKLTFDFQTDEEIQETLRSGDVIYFPQGPISYWATTGSARVAMTADRPVITSPEDQFEDMAAGVVFATDSDLPDVLRKLANPAYYEQVLLRLRRFRENNTISAVYQGALERLTDPAQVRRGAAATSAINVADLIALPTDTLAQAIYAAMFMRQPTQAESEQLAEVSDRNDKARLDAILSVAANALSQGFSLDLELGSFIEAHMLDANRPLAAVDRDRLISARQLLTLQSDVFIVEAMLALAKRLPTEEEAKEFGLMMAASGSDTHQRLHLLRRIAQVANRPRSMQTPVGDQYVHLHLRAAVPGQIQKSRRVYRLSLLGAYEPSYRSIAIYRALLKRNPTIREHLEMLALSEASFLDRVRELSSSAPQISLIDDIADTHTWATRLQIISDEIDAIGNLESDELTGNNLALVARQRLARLLPNFLLTTS
ncbi:glycosyltransferase [Paraburkholderia nemoris]|uniref:glycosyltransferase n=1 Tax=Paraburkholderia nemoris TaxID=2793076 RepID=UPI0038BD463B